MGTKLGLKIVKASLGMNSCFERNTEQSWTRYVRDTREDYKCIPTLEENSDASVILYSAIESGEFFTLISGIAGRAGDFVSAWIFVPSNIEISGKELESVINDTRVQILRDEINTETLITIFDKDYPQLELSKKCTRTVGNKLAVRYYGNQTYTLRELLNLLSQPENANYKAIFLIDSKSEIKANGCEDISNYKLKDSFIIEPPKPDQGFIPYFNDNSEFKSSIRATEGEVIKFVWRKRGYADIHDQITVKENARVVKSISPLDIKRLIYYQDIVVYDEDGLRITADYYIIVNGENLTLSHPVPVRKDALHDVRVKVSNISGYKDATSTIDFTQGSVPHTIRVKEERHTYYFEIPLRRGIDAKVEPIEVNSREELQRTPFEGYHSENGYWPMEGDHINRIIYSPDKKPLWKRLILPGICLIIGIIIGFGVTAYIYDEYKSSKAQTPQAQSSLHSAAQEQKREVPHPDAVQLLERSEWKKNEFDELTELKGLWDELNEHKFDKVLNRSGHLDDSRNFTVLKQVIRDFNDVGGKSEMFNGNNCPDGDIVITYNIYKGSIERKIQEIKKKSRSNSDAQIQTINKDKKQNSSPQSSSSKKEDKNDDYEI